MILNNYQIQGSQRSIWTMIMLFMPFLGLLIFVAVNKNNKR